MKKGDEVGDIMLPGKEKIIFKNQGFPYCMKKI